MKRFNPFIRTLRYIGMVLLVTILLLCLSGVTRCFASSPRDTQVVGQQLSKMLMFTNLSDMFDSCSNKSARFGLEPYTLVIEQSCLTVQPHFRGSVDKTLTINYRAMTFNRTVAGNH